MKEIKFKTGDIVKIHSPLQAGKLVIENELVLVINVKVLDQQFAQVIFNARGKNYRVKHYISDIIFCFRKIETDV
jgi:hypothetical protein